MSNVDPGWVRMYHPELDHDGEHQYAVVIQEAYEDVWESRGWKSDGEPLARPDDVPPVESQAESERVTTRRRGSDA